MLARKGLAFRGRMRTVGLGEGMLCVEQAILKPVSAKSEPVRFHALLSVDASLLRGPCKGNCQLTLVGRRGVVEGKIVVASEVGEPGRTAVRVPVGAVCEVWAWLAVGKPVVAIVFVVHGSHQNIPSWE